MRFIACVKKINNSTKSQKSSTTLVPPKAGLQILQEMPSMPATSETLRSSPLQEARSSNPVNLICMREQTSRPSRN